MRMMKLTFVFFRVSKAPRIEEIQADWYPNDWYHIPRGDGEELEDRIGEKLELSINWGNYPFLVVWSQGAQLAEDWFRPIYQFLKIVKSLIYLISRLKH